MTTDDPENIKAFNYIVLSVLTKLYGEFPKPIEIRGLRFVLETVLKKGPEAAEAKFSHLFNPTMMWLRQEGFIIFESNSDRDVFVGVTLTLRGLTILGFVPNSLFGPKETVFRRAKRALDKGIDEAAFGAIKRIATEAFKLMVQFSRSAGNI